MMAAVCDARVTKHLAPFDKAAVRRQDRRRLLVFRVGRTGCLHPGWPAGICRNHQHEGCDRERVVRRPAARIEAERSVRTAAYRRGHRSPYRKSGILARALPWRLASRAVEPAHDLLADHLGQRSRPRARAILRFSGRFAPMIRISGWGSVGFCWTGCLSGPTGGFGTEGAVLSRASMIAAMSGPSLVRADHWPVPQCAAGSVQWNPAVADCVVGAAIVRVTGGNGAGSAARSFRR